MAIANRELNSPDIFQQQVDSLEFITGEQLLPGSVGETTLEALQQNAKRFSVFKDFHLQSQQGTLDEYRLDQITQRLANLNYLDQLANSLSEFLADQGRTSYLRPSQRTALSKKVDLLLKGEQKAYDVMPTGTGKTIVLLVCLQAFMSQNPDLRAIVATSSIDSVTQIQKKFKQYAPELMTGIVYSGKKDFDEQVTITTFQSLVQNVASGNFEPSQYPIMCLDEAHDMTSALRSRTVGLFDKSVIFGFTATPGYTSRKHIGRMLPNETFSMTLQEAVDEGSNCSFSVIYGQTEVDLSQVPLVGNEYKLDELEEAINVSARNQTIVDSYLSLFNGERGFGFCRGIEYAKSLAQLFQDNGIAADYGCGRMSTKKRENRLNALHEGKLKLLFGDRLYAQAIDQPRVTLGLHVEPTYSHVRAVQRMRAGRPDPENPAKHSYYFELLDRDKRRGRSPITTAEVAGSVHLLPNAEPEEYKFARRKRIDQVADRARYIQIPGLKVVTTTEEVWSITRQLMEQRDLTPPPEDWILLQAAAKNLGIMPTTIREFINKKGFQHLIGVYADNGKRRLYVNWRELEAHQSLTPILQTTLQTSDIDIMRAKYIQDQERREDLRKAVNLPLSQRLIPKHADIQLPQNGELNTEQLASVLGVTAKTVKYIMSKYPFNYADFVVTRRGVTGNLGMYYSSEVLEHLKKAWGNREKAPSTPLGL